MKFLREFKVGDIIKCVYAEDFVTNASFFKGDYFKIVKCNEKEQIKVLPLNKHRPRIMFMYNLPIIFTASTNYYKFELAGQDYIVKKLKGTVK